MESEFLGKCKDSLDRIKVSLLVELFGPFLRYLTSDKQQELSATCDAFAVLMASQIEQSLPGLPLCVLVRTKDKLYNKFLGLLKEIFSSK